MVAVANSDVIQTYLGRSKRSLDYKTEKRLETYRNFLLRAETRFHFMVVCRGAES